MAEQQTVVAESSTAPVIPSFEVERGPLVTWTPEQRSEFRKTGEPPKKETPKAEEPAASRPSEADQAESRTAPEADNKQDPAKPKAADQPKPKLSAEER